MPDYDPSGALVQRLETRPKEDLFRRHIVPQDPKMVEKANLIKAALEDALDLVMELPEGRERAIAITKMEEVAFWATKAATV